MAPFAELTVAGDRYTGDRGWSAQMMQAEYGHDMAVLTGQLVSTLNRRYPEGAPVQLRWGRGHGLVATYVGYVHHPVSSYDGPAATSGRIVVIGASSVLRDAASATWPSGSRAYVPVQRAALAVHFSSLTEGTPLGAAGGPLHGESQWAYLVRNARSVGYTLYCPGTDLRCHSRRISRIPPVPTFTYYGGGITAGAQLYSYKILAGSDLPDDGALRRIRQVRGVTDGGQLVRLSDDATLESTGGWLNSPPQYTKGHPTAVHGYLEAQQRLTAVNEENRFFYRATATVSGDERVHQGSTVVLTGIDRYLDGYWYVLEASHSVGTAAYSMTLTLGRDALGDVAPAVQPAKSPVIGPGIREEERASPPVLARQNRNAVQMVQVVEQTGTWISSIAESRRHLRWRGPVSG